MKTAVCELWDLLQLDAFRQPRLRPVASGHASRMCSRPWLSTVRPRPHRPAGGEREIDKLAPLDALELPTGFRIGVSSKRLTRHRLNARQY
jgi:hypothetical protein